MPPIMPQYFQPPMTPATSKPKHPPIPPLPRKPLLRLEIRDLSSKGSIAFLSLPECGSILQNAVNTVLAWLYTRSSKIPPTRSITLILRDMPGVAYTTGTDIDSDHKEIHFSTSYIEGQMHKDGFEKEVLGVVTHEMVHCWQWNARGSCPGGLIEGVADYVRLRAGFVPGHWKKEAGGEWDAGYQHTGYFLDYLERRFGEGTVVKINEALRDRVYKEVIFWEECCGCRVEELWEEYGRHLKKEKGKESDGQDSEESFEIVDAVEETRGEHLASKDQIPESFRLDEHAQFLASHRINRPQGQDNRGKGEDDEEEDDEVHDPEMQRQLQILSEQSMPRLQETIAKAMQEDPAFFTRIKFKPNLAQQTQPGMLQSQDDLQPYFPEPTSGSVFQADSGREYGRSLQDHQSMLLEQQNNKRRLVVARQGLSEDLNEEGGQSHEDHLSGTEAQRAHQQQLRLLKMQDKKQGKEKEEDMADATNPFL